MFLGSIYTYLYELIAREKYESICLQQACRRRVGTWPTSALLPVRMLTESRSSKLSTSPNRFGIISSTRSVRKYVKGI